MLGVELLASESALNPRSLEMFSLTTFFREPKSDVNNPVSSPTYMEQKPTQSNSTKWLGSYGDTHAFKMETTITSEITALYSNNSYLVTVKKLDLQGRTKRNTMN